MYVAFINWPSAGYPRSVGRFGAQEQRSSSTRTHSWLGLLSGAGDRWTRGSRDRVPDTERSTEKTRFRSQMSKTWLSHVMTQQRTLRTPSFRSLCSFVWSKGSRRQLKEYVFGRGCAQVTLIPSELLTCSNVNRNLSKLVENHHSCRTSGWDSEDTD